MEVHSQSTNSNKYEVLLLGAGFVSHPFVEYLARYDDTRVTVVSSIEGEVIDISKNYANVTPVVLDVTKDKKKLNEMIKDHQLIVSLLPHPLHPIVARLCISEKKNLVTASYATPFMREFHQSALDAGISIMMEVGLDPGIDHMLAMECIKNIKERNGKIVSFKSWCGGLPAREVADNPLGYKFSWFPVGVLMGTIAPSKCLLNGKTVEKNAGGDNFRAGPLHIDFMPELNLEGFVNGNSIPYKEAYKLFDANTVLRGTLRYKGFVDAMTGLLSLGLLSQEKHNLLSESAPNLNWRQFIAHLLHINENISDKELRDLVYEAVGKSENRLQAVKGLGLLGDASVNKASGTPMASLSQLLSSHLVYKKGERDMVVMRHEVEAVFENRKKEKHSVDLVEYGDPNKYTAMAKTVGYPCAIAARMLLLDKISEKGILLPTKEEIYQPILSELWKIGIRWKNNVAHC